MPDPLLKYRSHFPILEKTIYMISNSLGAMPREVQDTLARYTDLWATRGVRAWEEEWWDLAHTVGDEVGVLMNAAPGTVSLHQNVTFCQAIVASCLEFTPKRNKVVFDDMNFPSVMYFWHAHAAAHGGEVVVTPSDGIHVNLQALLDAIDERTLVVPISHVAFRSAFIQDARAIVEKAHQVGALVVLDTFQSLGTVPVDVQHIKPDFVTGGVLKWLCGGPGTCYLYVDPDLAPKLKPRLTGWVAHEHPFDFAVGAQNYTDTSYRFMNGTPNVPALYAARPGLKIIREVGLDAIRAKSKRQTARLIELADKRGWKVNTPRDPEQRSGTVSIDMPDSYHVCRELLKRDVVVDYRPQAGVRFSPHFYTKDEELDQAISAVEQILSERAVTK